MRNKHAGPCYRCPKVVEIGDGHFERFRGGWRLQHAICAIEHRGTPDPRREADTRRAMEQRAVGTGKSAQRARRWLRDIECPEPTP